MHTSRTIVLTLVLGLLVQAGTYAEQPVKLEAKEGDYQFPFFDIQLPPLLQIS